MTLLVTLFVLHYDMLRKRGTSGASSGTFYPRILSPALFTGNSLEHQPSPYLPYWPQYCPELAVTDCFATLRPIITIAVGQALKLRTLQLTPPPCDSARCINRYASSRTAVGKGPREDVHKMACRWGRTLDYVADSRTAGSITNYHNVRFKSTTW